MILQALTKLYEDLAEQGKIAREGWNAVKISYLLEIDEDGTLLGIVPQFKEVVSGKKTLSVPMDKILPAAVKRSSGIASNFLWDNSAYMLGIDGKGKPERAKECFEACKGFHRELLDGIDTAAARAILNFFDGWEPASAAEHPLIVENLNELYKGGNVTFYVNGRLAAEDAEIKAAWQRYYDNSDGERMQCLVTGKEDVIMPTHPAIKGVADAQSSGAALVSFNASAFCSYGKEQNYNAPVGKYAAFAYTSALNYLLSDKENVHRIGDTTVVCWAEGAEEQYNGLTNMWMFGDDNNTGLSDADLYAAVKRITEGKYCNELKIDPKRPYYVLGLAPNAARLSVSFFLRNEFGSFIRNVNEHYERMEIVKSKFDKFDTLPIWAMLNETVNPKSQDKKPSSVLAKSTARAIFSGTAYPAALLNGAMLRIRAERNITRGRAAIIKAYYLKNTNKGCPKEVLTVSLNEQSTNIPYTLGRLFAYYEKVQKEVNPEINATIVDKYYISAMSTPARTFKLLNGLYQSHLRKLYRLNKDRARWFDMEVGKLKDVFDETYPIKHTSQEQCSFDLGYYHQKQWFYTKKEDR